MLPLQISNAQTLKMPMIVLCETGNHDDSISDRLCQSLMFKLDLPPASLEQELAILTYWHKQFEQHPIITGKEDIFSFRSMVNDMDVASNLQRYIVQLIAGARPENPDMVPIIAKYVEKGPNAYASILLLKAAKAWAAFQSREAVTQADIQVIGSHILPHQLLLHSHADITSGTVYEKFLNEIEAKYGNVEPGGPK